MRGTTIRVTTAAIALGLAVLPWLPAQGATPKTKRVSVRSNGDEADASSSDSSISANGRFVAFRSDATNLVGGDDNATADIFVHDKKTKKTKRVSVRSNGAQANSGSYNPSISANGRFVAFQSDAANLVSGGDNNPETDVFVHDRKAKKTKLVSVRSNGAQANGVSGDPSISATGRFVAFESEATNLVIGGDDNGNVTDVFVHDRKTKKTKLASVRTNGTQGDSHAEEPSISANGRFVAFHTETDLVASDDNGRSDVFVHNRETKKTKRVSVRSNGAQADFGSHNSSISANGRFVAFQSDATNLVGGDTNGDIDIFVHDRKTKKTKRVSVRSNGAEAVGASQRASISGDGRFVAFQSSASNLVGADDNSDADVFVRGPLR